MILNKKGNMDMSMLVKGALVMIVVLVIIFGIVRGVNIAASDSTTKNDDYLDALDDCDSGDALCKDTLLEKIRGAESSGGNSK